MKRLLLFSLIALPLAGCSAAMDYGRELMGRSDDASSSEVRVSDARTAQSFASEPLSAPVTAKKTSSLAILALPDDVVAQGNLTERQYANGWRQSVSLGSAKTAGDWNDLSIDIQTEAAETGRAAQIPIGKPTQEGVRREIIARFPTTPMRIVTRPMRNSLGPFGLAVGADAGGMRCAFAWQWLDNLPGASGAPASIRMRLCRTGVTADQLAEAFERLEIVSSANIERVVESTKLSAGVGRDIIMPQGQGVLADAPVSLESSIIAASRAPVARTAAVEAPHRIAARRRPRAVEPEPERELSAPVASVDGRQYLAPVPAQTSSYAAPQLASPRGGAGFGTVRANLPPEAYRGPTMAQSGGRDRAAPASQSGDKVYLAPQ